MKTSSKLLALGFVTGLLAGVAMAQVPPTRATDPAAVLMPPSPLGDPGQRWTVAQLQQSFALADANGDGQLTRAEAQQLAILPRSFEDLDRDKDGVLTPQEYHLGAH